MDEFLEKDAVEAVVVGGELPESLDVGRIAGHGTRGELGPEAERVLLQDTYLAAERESGECVMRPPARGR